MSDATLLIDGQSVPTDARFGVVNPATEEVFAQAPDASRENLEAAVAGFTTPKLSLIHI